MLAAGVIIGALFIVSMKRRKQTGDERVGDLEAKRDALVQRLREVDLPEAEKRRLEVEAAGVTEDDRLGAALPQLRVAPWAPLRGALR